MYLLRQAPVLALASVSLALNIILNNDDSFVSANIREFYKALKAAGHKVLLVAPAVNQSGKGGTVSIASPLSRLICVLIRNRLYLTPTPISLDLQSSTIFLLDLHL
jgi:hypothetical protein